ncbi:hypothetical protein C8R45DRAFT_1167257, partial [Mycena sanguinolenta]
GNDSISWSYDTCHFQPESVASQFSLKTSWNKLGKILAESPPGPRSGMLFCAAPASGRQFDDSELLFRAARNLPEAGSRPAPLVFFCSMASDSHRNLSVAAPVFPTQLHECSAWAFNNLTRYRGVRHMYPGRPWIDREPRYKTRISGLSVKITFASNSMQFSSFFGFLAVLSASAQVNAQLAHWFCTCETNGVVDSSLMVSCCSSVSGNIDGEECSLVSGTDPTQSVSGTFLQCCLDNGQGAECTH